MRMNWLLTRVGRFRSERRADRFASTMNGQRRFQKPIFGALSPRREAILTSFTPVSYDLSGRLKMFEELKMNIG